MIIKRIARKVDQKKVAAYARVSTLTEEQEESFETQVNYYSQLIAQTEGWEMVEVYADSGITGTSAKKRPEFMRMIEDARAGKINLILCKSVSRFSRNFKEAQELIHELKAVNVEVWFEKEGIHTFEPSADLIFSVMAAISQEESRSISENVKWSYRRLAEQGIRHVGNHRMLGFEEVKGKLSPNKDAWIVRMIFEAYASGTNVHQIIQCLNQAGAKRMRSERDFNDSAIMSILRNEAYVGDRLIQKTAPQNFLTKEPDQAEAYDSRYIRGDHEAIISRDTWEKVQNRLLKEKEARDRGVFADHRSHFLYGKVFCAECGEPYRRFTARNQTGLYKIWRCRGHVAGKCTNRHIREDELMKIICSKMKWRQIDEWKITESADKVLVNRETIEVIMA